MRYSTTYLEDIAETTEKTTMPEETFGRHVGNIICSQDLVFARHSLINDWEAVENWDQEGAIGEKKLSKIAIYLRVACDTCISTVDTVCVCMVMQIKLVVVVIVDIAIFLFPPNFSSVRIS